MKKYEVTIIEVVDDMGSHIEMTVQLEAEDPTKAVEAAKPPHKSKYGRTYKVKELP